MKIQLREMKTGFMYQITIILAGVERKIFMAYRNGWLCDDAAGHRYHFGDERIISVDDLGLNQDIF